jgi:adenosylmethionine-8-amino-7-oxononanoate aminotransferase
MARDAPISGDRLQRTALAGVSELCDRHGILFCADEVITGFGRLGEWFASRGFLSPRLFERGLLCRADDRGDPVVQISPPLVARQEQFDEIAEILGGVLDEASDRMAVAT